MLSQARFNPLLLHLWRRLVPSESHCPPLGFAPIAAHGWVVRRYLHASGTFSRSVCCLQPSWQCLPRSSPGQSLASLASHMQVSAPQADAARDDLPMGVQQQVLVPAGYPCARRMCKA